MEKQLKTRPWTISRAEFFVAGELLSNKIPLETRGILADIWLL